MDIGRIIREKEMVFNLWKRIGTCEYSNKEKYTGEWGNDMRNGTGIEY